MSNNSYLNAVVIGGIIGTRIASSINANREQKERHKANSNLIQNLKETVGPGIALYVQTNYDAAGAPVDYDMWSAIENAIETYVYQYTYYKHGESAADFIVGQRKKLMKYSVPFYLEAELKKCLAKQEASKNIEYDSRQLQGIETFEEFAALSPEEITLFVSGRFFYIDNFISKNDTGGYVVDGKNFDSLSAAKSHISGASSMVVL